MYSSQYYRPKDIWLLLFQWYNFHRMVQSIRWPMMIRWQETPEISSKAKGPESSLKGK
jgi:hypothetical protein